MAAINLQSSLSQSLNFGLQARYCFDGNLNDSTSNNNHLQLNVGTTQYFSNGNLGSALYTNGSTQYESILPFNTTGYTSIAVSMWVKSSGADPSGTSILQGAYSGFGMSIWGTTNQMLGFFDGSSASSYLSSQAITDGNWHHVVAQNDGSTTYLYIDGILDGKQAETLLTPAYASTNKLFLGMLKQQTNPYTGYVDEIRIYNRTLSDCEILELYKQLNPNPVVHYSFESALVDSSASLNHFVKITGTEQYLSSGAIDSAIYIDGSTQYESSQPFNTDGFNQVAVSMWVKTSTVDPSGTSILQGAYSGFGMSIWGTSGQMLGFFDGSSASSYLSTNPITDSSWHHVVAQNNGDSTYLYIDGTLDGKQAETLLTPAYASTNKLYLGMLKQQTNPFTGAVDEIKIFNRFLSECEIEDLGTQKHFTSSKPLSKKVENIVIYPNPTNNILNINFSDIKENIKISVIDIQGKVHEVFSFQKLSKVTLELNKKPGTYFLVFESDFIATYKKLVVIE